MASLEGEARPILTPLVLGEPRDLSALDQETVAVWETKTMFTLQGTSLDESRVVSEETYRMVR